MTTQSCIKKAAWIYVAAFLLLAFSFHAEARDTKPKTSKKSDSQAETKAEKKDAGKMTTVVMETSLGTIEIEVNGEKAPISAKNFLQYVDDKFYDGTIFHRVIKNFMIQGGGFTESMEQKKTRGTIKNEADNGLKNVAGTLAMARLPNPDSASSQFFINVVDNEGLDHKNKTPGGYGYAVFGKVTAGMDVVEKIKAVSTTRKGQYDDVPSTPVVIKSIKRK